MKKKFNKTTLGVLLFITILILAGFNVMNANADSGLRLGVGNTVINSHLKIGELSYRYNNWEVGASITESGDTKNGKQGNSYVYSVSHLTTPNWKILKANNYYRLGFAYVDKSKLVGPTNYRLGIGLDWKVFSLEYVHYSSAGIHNVNTGLDAVILKYHFPD